MKPSSPICALCKGQSSISSASSASASSAFESVGGALGDLTLLGGEVEGFERDDSGCGAGPEAG